ncbi:MAG TPA: hypothetical protein VHZ95_05795 [Polyangiales bacterium]|nr:hypothetical protein [Polyangiales bacterium]
MSACSIEPASDALRVIAVPERTWNDDVQQRVAELWAEEQRRSPALFEGTLLTFVARTDAGLLGRFVDYRYYVAQRRDPSLRSELAITPLSVCGLIDCAGEVAFAERSADSTQYPGAIELIPSGGIDKAQLREDGSVDHRAQLVQELAEETGIGAAEIVSVQMAALLRDEIDEVVDIASIIVVTPAARAIAERTIARGTGEHRALVWIAIAALSDYLDRHRASMVPTSHALASLYLRRPR